MSSANRTSFIAGIAPVVLFFAIAGLAWFEVVPGIGREIAIVPAAIGVILGVILLISRLSARRAERRMTPWRASALERGFRFTPRLQGPGLPGLLFREGTAVVLTDVVDALDSDTPFLAATMMGRYADDSSAPRMVRSSVIAIPLRRSVPNIVLVSSALGIMARAGFAVKGRQRLSLEGDFDRSFTLYCPEGYERDALEIFTPDLMQLVIDTTTRCDIELVDEWMFIYSDPGLRPERRTVDGIVAATERVQQKVHRQTARYTDERAAPLAASPAVSRTVSPEEHAARAGKVAASGSRLRTTTSWPQRVFTWGLSACILGALIWTYFTEIAPGL